MKLSIPMVMGISAALLLTPGCHQKLVFQGSPRPQISPAPSSKPGTVTLTVDVNTGGDCVGLNDTFQVIGAAKNFKDAPVLATATRGQVIAQGGIVPCTFRFYAADVPRSNAYFILDETMNQGWGPWSPDGLQRANFHVSVSITDMH